MCILTSTGSLKTLWKGQMHENQNKSVSVTAMSYKFIRNQQFYDVNNKTLTTQGNLQQIFQRHHISVVQATGIAPDLGKVTFRRSQIVFHLQTSSWLASVAWISQCANVHKSLDFQDGGRVIAWVGDVEKNKNMTLKQHNFYVICNGMPVLDAYKTKTSHHNKKYLISWKQWLMKTSS